MFLSIIFDGFDKISYFLCLDVKIMKELGCVEFVFVIGLGFYGVYVIVSSKEIERVIGFFM